MKVQGFAQGRRREVRDSAPGAIGQWLQWRINRLRCMTPAEIVHRLVRALSAHVQRSGLFGTTSAPAADLSPSPPCWIQTAAGVNTSAYIAAAERIARGRLTLFALCDLDPGSPPRWNRDPKTGVDAPLSFGKLIDYRDVRRVGDIKYLWELNRHLHLVTLAQAYALSGRTRYGEVLCSHVESWLRACPVGIGPNWSSALEVAIRLINWSAAWQLIGGARSPLFADAPGARLRHGWLDSVYCHARFVRGYFSRHSSANNHLIGEAAGLFIAAMTWPYWREAHAWRAESKAVLEQEALLQNAPDGVNREQAVGYQQFVLELLLLVWLAGKASGEVFPAAFSARIEAMLEYLASIMDAGGNLPAIGDSDDALVLKLDATPEFSSCRSLLATGALLFRRGDFKTKAERLDDKTRWLCGEGADAAFRELPRTRAPLPVRRVYAEGGYYILGCAFETDDEIRLVVDAGAIGYQSIAAHGHADALAFTLSIGGTQFLIDPGTYAYHTHKRWRDYFRGTAAHNTVRVDGEDQSRRGGNFMWLQKANAACTRWASFEHADVFEGRHDGYLRLIDPVIHSRRIDLDKHARRISIEDRLQMSGEHEIELFFHCSERCTVRRSADGYMLRLGTKTLLLRLPQNEAGSAAMYCGSSAPICGWVSRRFDEKVPAPTIVWKSRLSGYTVLRSEIVC